MVEYDRSQAAETGGKHSPRICVAGIGGAGNNVLDRIAIDRTVEAKLITFQTDERVLNRTNAPHRVQLGAELMRGVGAGGDPDLGREAALFSKAEIHAAIDGHEMVFISAGLGGGTGSGAAPVVAEIAKSTGAVVVVFATIPFSFEGRRRAVQSNDALSRLAKSADALILFDNNRMGELVLPKDGIQKAFAQGDQLIAQSVRAVSSMVNVPGLVKLGLNDLKTALRVSEGRCLFGFGEAKGQNRGAEALKKALKSPLINQGELLVQARNLLVHIVGGEDLTLVEVESVMKQLGRHVPDETQILFGLSVDPKLGDNISITLVSALSTQELATARRQVEETPEPAPVAKPEKVQAPVEVISKLTPAPAPEAAPVSVAVQAPVAAAPVAVEVAPALGDLFGGPITTAPEVEKPVVPEAPAVVATPPVVVASPVQQEVPPSPPAPAPVEEVVYAAADETLEEIEAEPVKPVPAVRESTRVNLLSVIKRDKPVAEIKAAEPPVLAPVPETAPVAIARTATSTSQVSAPVPEPVVVAAPVAVAEPQELFGTLAQREAAPAPVKKETPVEQSTLRFAGEDRSAHFKNTEPSFATQGNEDLDTPTWMRLRRRTAK